MIYRFSVPENSHLPRSLRKERGVALMNRPPH